MVCIRDTPCEIVAKDLTPAACLSLISDASDEVYMVPGGYRLGKIVLSGSIPFPVGVAGDTLYFQFVKPCFGIFAMKIENGREEIDALRSAYYGGRYGPDKKTDAEAVTRIK